MVSDASIIGGGPAGLAAAIALRQRGFSVTVLDSRKPPIDKACGEGLLPNAFPALRELGINTLTGATLRGIHFSSNQFAISGRFSTGEGMGVRRTVLHEALVERATSLGVDLQWNRPVSDFQNLPSQWIIGADGIQSRIRQWAGLGAIKGGTVRYGFQRHYEIPPWSDEVEVYWGNLGQLYVTPVADNQVGIAILTRKKGIRFDDILAEFPNMQQRLAKATPTSDRGGITSFRTLRRVTTSRVALVGDASGSVDAITGEGLALTFHQSLLLARSLETGSLQKYEQGHRTLSRRTRILGGLMLVMDRSAILRRRTLAVMSARPDLFTRLIDLHTGEPTMPELLAGCASLGVSLARPLFF